MKQQNKKLNLSIAKQFSITPGGRYKKEGDNSGEEFFEKYLFPMYLMAESEGKKLLIDLDGCMGYPSSFLDESFGGLARRFPDKDIFSVIEFKSEDEPGLPDTIKKIIERSGKK